MGNSHDTKAEAAYDTEMPERERKDFQGNTHREDICNRNVISQPDR